MGLVAVQMPGLVGHPHRLDPRQRLQTTAATDLSRCDQEDDPDEGGEVVGGALTCGALTCGTLVGETATVGIPAGVEAVAIGGPKSISLRSMASVGPVTDDLGCMTAAGASADSSSLTL